MLCLKKYRDSIKGIATLAKIQSAREGSHNLTLMGNCQTFYLRACLCLNHLGLLVWPNSKVQGDCITF